MESKLNALSKKIVNIYNDLEMIVGTSRKSNQAPSAKPKTPSISHEETNLQFILKSIENRDYSGAATFIDFLFNELNQKPTKELLLWKGYSYFHLGDYSSAIEVYSNLLQEDPSDDVLNLYISSCYYYLREFQTAREFAEKGPSCDFQIRLMFHIAHQLNNEEEVHLTHSKLVGTLENQMSLAAIHYMRSHFQDAIDIYQKILTQEPSYTALNVYIAMCLFKLEQFQESNEFDDQYLQFNSDSAVALNLKSCDYLRLFDPEIAQSQLLQVSKFSTASYTFVDTLIKHNLCIFQNGEGGFKVLPSLVNSLPEARYNLAVLYLRQNNPIEAFHLLENYHAIDISESILKADVQMAISQLTGDSAALEEACQTFTEVGESEARDTVPGRQCLASAKFISNDFEEGLRVLQSIEEQIGDTDEFNYDKAMSLATLSRWAEAETYFLKVQNPVYTKEIFYTSWLCRCYIKNRRSEEAWKLYVDCTSTEDAKTLLQIIANDCFLSGAYYYSMKAYDILCKCDTDPTFKEGMIASSIGVFRNELAMGNLAESDKINEVLAALSSEEDTESILNTIQHYLEENFQGQTEY